MTSYLDVEDLIDINKSVLQEGEEHRVTDRSDLIYINKIVKQNYIDDIFKKATLLCVAIIVHHPFMEGNHRTSLAAAEIFLRKNGYSYTGTDEDRLALHGWRLDYEEEHQLERRWLTMIGGIYHRGNVEANLVGFMEDDYAKKIEAYLRKYSEN